MKEQFVEVVKPPRSIRETAKFWASIITKIIVVPIFLLICLPFLVIFAFFKFIKEFVEEVIWDIFD